MHKQRITDQPIRPVSYGATIDLSLDIAKIARDRGDQRLLAVTYSDVKKDYFRLENYDKALEYAEKELAIRDDTKFNSTIPNTKFFIGNIKLLKKDYNDAIMDFNEALPNATDSLKLDIYDGLKKAYLGLGKTTQALQSMEHYNIVKDSINNKNTRASIAEITSQYQDEQQKQEIRTLNFQNEAKAEKISKQRLTLFSTIAVGLLLLLLGYFGYKNYKSKQDLSYTQLNFKLLQTQLNPHFMFNALNEIKINLKTQKGSQTSEYLTAYSKLMRLILESSNEDFVSIENDVNLISKFLQLQQLVNDNGFSYQVKVDASIDTHYMQIPTMLTQPFVENAVLHGVKEAKDGHIDVFYSLKDGHIEVDISDNGKGFIANKKHSGKELHKSLGTKISSQRLKNYDKLFNYKIEVTTLSNKNSGTRIHIKMPLKLKHL
jgi:tetratricopeptide (TPR) repeat protein